MAFKSEFIADKLGDFWRRFKELDVLKGYWDGKIELSSNISLNLTEINQGKALSTVPVFRTSSPVPFVLDGSTEAAAVPAGFQTAYVIKSDIVSIPAMASKSDGSGAIFFEGTAYQITSPGVLAFKTIPPRLLCAETVISDHDTIFRNFGFPIDFRKKSSEIYKAQTTGLWYALWNARTPNNLALAVHILMDLPFVQRGRVISISTNPDGSKDILVNGQTFNIADFLEPAVFVGQEITNFTRLSTGVELFDFINNPNFFEIIDLPQVQKFFTFLPIILADVVIAIELATGEIFDFSFIQSFLRRVKPAYTDCIIGILLKLEDRIQLFIDAADIQEKLLLTKTVDVNYMNYLIIPEFITVNSIPGATLEDQVDAVKDMTEFALDEEVIGLKEDLEVHTDVDLILTPTVGNGPLVPASPAEGVNPVNHFSIGAPFETLNGVTLTQYNDHLTDFPEFDLDLETVGFKDTLEVRDLISGTPLVTV